MAEMMVAKTDIQNLGHLSGYVTVCQSLDARIKAIEDSMTAQNTQTTITPDVMAGGNDSWTSYLNGGSWRAGHGGIWRASISWGWR